MPEEIVARILRLAGYGVYACEADEARNTLTLAGATAETAAYRSTSRTTTTDAACTR